MRLGVWLSLALLCAIASPLRAASDKDFADCEKGDSPDRVIAACTRIVQDRREDPKTRSDAHFNRGQAYSKKGDRDRAIADYGEAIKLDAKNTMALYNRGHTYLVKRDYDRAIADNSAGIRIDPDVPLGYINRGVAYHANGQLESALADYEAALKRDPKLSFALYGRGLVRLKRGDAAAGEADIAAAKAILAQVAEVFDRHGLK